MHTEVIEELPHLRAYARSLCGDAVQADDLVQTTCLKALKNIDRFKEGTNLRAWLFTILRNTFISEFRRKSAEVELPEEADSFISGPAGNQEATCEMQDVARALHKMKPEFRETLLLVGAAGFQYEEVAEMMELEVGTVKSRVSRARRQLRQALENEQALPPLKQAKETLAQLLHFVTPTRTKPGRGKMQPADLALAA